MSHELPLVSALMVTRDRVQLASRAIACLAAQTWRHIELVVIDDGTADYGPLLARYRDKLTIRHVRLEHDPARKLGALRNLALEHARGALLAQWDDDEWYHPERLATQVAYLQAHALDTVVTRRHLVHLGPSGFGGRVFRSDAPGGMPGSILHKPTTLRYPNLARSEDLVFFEALRERTRTGCIEHDEAHLFVRCYHGRNTWSRAHFERRLRRTKTDTLHYALARFVRRDLFTHPAFALCASESASAAQFLAESRALGLFEHEHA